MRRTYALLLALALFMPMIALAQVADEQVYEISDFGKLLQSHINPYLVPSEAAIDARNLRANETYGELSKRPQMLLFGTVGSAKVTGLHRFYKSNNTAYLIAGGSTYLYRGNDDAGTFTVIRDELTEGQSWSCVTYMDKAICMNGSDNAQKYDGKTDTTDDTDGARTASILTADLGAPFAELNTGANLDASSWYQYKIAFYDGTTYSYSSARSNPILTGATVQDITLTDIPLGPAGTTQRLIYRTVGKASRAAVEADTSFYLVDTLSDNTTTTYNDTNDDATILGDAAPTWSTVSTGTTDVAPPVCKYGIIHNERLFIANETNNNSDIYWSPVFRPDYFDTSTDYEQIRPDDGDQITFIKSLLGVLVIGKTNTIQKLLTTNSDSTKWIVTDPFSFIGCPAPLSAVSSPIGILYLSYNGLYVFNGEGSSLLSDAVTNVVRDMLVTNFNEAAGIYHDNIYQIAYTSEESGSAENDRVLVLDIVRDAYQIDDKSVSVFEVFDSGNDYGTLYSGSSENDGKVMAHSFSPSNYIVKLKSALEGGTMDSVIITGSETDPGMELGWGITLNSVVMSGITLNSATMSGKLINRGSTTGYWYSPIVRVNASGYDKIYWNESLGAYGDVTFSVRSGASNSSVIVAGFGSEYTDPSGSDLSGETADDYVQIRGKLSTSDIHYTPSLYLNNNYVVKMTYNKEGTAGETSFLTVWESGWLNFGRSVNKKRIREVEVFYSGTSGMVNFNIQNSEGDIDTTFEIDLSIDPDNSTTDMYEGSQEYKAFTWEPPINSVTEPTPIGEFFKFRITENGLEQWSIRRIVFRYDIEEIY